MATQRSYTAATLNNQFGLQLFRSLRLGTAENCFFSPLSITTALAMTFMGTRGDTAKQIEDVMKLSSIGKDVHHGFKDLNSTIFPYPPPNQYQLKLANRLYGQKGFNFVPEFLSSTRDIYGAQLEAVDFVKETEATRKAINTWVEEQTAGKIQQLLAPGILSVDSRLVLVNAIYFKGEWVEQFKALSTRDKPFYLSLSNKKSVPMMYQEEHFDFYYDESAKCKVLVMRYKGGAIDMMIALPDDITGLAKLESTLSDDVFRSWSSKVRRVKVKVTLPKFKFSKSFSLVDCLKRMGITDLFQDGKADLSGVAEDELVVSEVIHKAFLEVNEKGSEAAAATAVMMTRQCALVMKEEESKVFKADHPFVFFIRDRITEAVLFMGHVMCPVLE